MQVFGASICSAAAAAEEFSQDALSYPKPRKNTGWFLHVFGRRFSSLVSRMQKERLDVPGAC